MNNLVQILIMITLAVSYTNSYSQSTDFLADNITPESKAVVSPGVLNMRSGPDKQADITRKLFHGEVLTILNANGEWIKVEISDQIGWVHSNFVKIKNRSLIPTDSERTETIASNLATIKTAGEAIDLLEINMSTDQVRRLFAEPDTVKQIFENVNKRLIWKYNLQDKKLLHLTFINDYLLAWQISNLKNIN